MVPHIETEAAVAGGVTATIAGGVAAADTDTGTGPAVGDCAVHGPLGEPGVPGNQLGRRVPPAVLSPTSAQRDGGRTHVVRLPRLCLVPRLNTDLANEYG